MLYTNAPEDLSCYKLLIDEMAKAIEIFFWINVAKADFNQNSIRCLKATANKLIDCQLKSNLDLISVGFSQRIVMHKLMALATSVSP